MNAAPIQGIITRAVGVCGLNVIMAETTKQNPMNESALLATRCIGLRSIQTNRAPTANSKTRNGVRKKNGVLVSVEICGCRDQARSANCSQDYWGSFCKL